VLAIWEVVGHLDILVNRGTVMEQVDASGHHYFRPRDAVAAARVEHADALHSLTTLNWLRFPGGDEDVAAPSPAWPLERVMDAVARAGSPGIGLDVYTIAHHVDAGGRLEDVAAMLRSRELVCTDVAPLLDRGGWKPRGRRGVRPRSGGHRRRDLHRRRLLADRRATT
jgi:hypothetical protein